MVLKQTDVSVRLLDFQMQGLEFVMLIEYVKAMHTVTRETKFSAQLRGQHYTFYTTWGLFSPERIDEGTRLLIDELALPETGTFLDLGCGYGPIGMTMAALAPKALVHMVDKDFVAVEYAKKNAEMNGVENCEVYLSNGFSHVPKEVRFHVIASNLPAKPSKELFLILFEDARSHLSSGGAFYVVVLSGLKEFIKRELEMTFGNCKKLKQGRTHCVFVAYQKES